MQGTRYAGDLSRADMQVLAEFAMSHRRVLEFGAGASTTIFALRGDQTADFVCIETDPAWVDRTRGNLRRLNARVPTWWTWDDWKTFPHTEFDLIFVDGAEHLRTEFAARAWDQLGECGSLLWHDCRAGATSRDIMAFAADRLDGIEAIMPSYRGSNIAVIRKRMVLREENWHEHERLADGAVATFPQEVGFGSKEEMLRHLERHRTGT